ncbi:MAG: hypothetical protein IH945_09405 [Armatimonadetes bacterium]|nr:hypothetical protein [Armatimonadota bacterium]
MYGKRFQLWSRIGVYTATAVLVAVTLFGSIAPASPTLERTKRNIEKERDLWAPMCGFGFEIWLSQQKD